MSSKINQKHGMFIRIYIRNKGKSTKVLFINIASLRQWILDNQSFHRWSRDFRQPNFCPTEGCSEFHGQNRITRKLEVKWNKKARLYLEKERVKISTADNEEWGPGESDTHGISWWQECERIAENHLRKEVLKMDGRD